MQSSLQQASIPYILIYSHILKVPYKYCFFGYDSHLEHVLGSQQSYF